MVPADRVAPTAVASDLVVPATVRLAAKLIYVHLAVSVVVDMVYLVVFRDALAGGVFGLLSPETLLGLLLVIAVAVGLAVLVVRGRNWARVVVTILTAVTVAQALYQVVGFAVVGPSGSFAGSTAQLGYTAVTEMILVGLRVATVVLLYRPTSNTFFTGRY